MNGVRYRIVQDLPPQVRTPEFVDLADNQVRVRVIAEPGGVTIIAHGADVRLCEELLRRLGATDLGLDLCG